MTGRILMKIYRWYGWYHTKSKGTVVFLSRDTYQSNMTFQFGKIWCSTCLRLLQFSKVSRWNLKGQYLDRSSHGPSTKVSTSCTRWWFQISFIVNLCWGNDPIWRAYFSGGLKPPTRCSKMIYKLIQSLVVQWHASNNHLLIPLLHESHFPKKNPTVCHKDMSLLDIRKVRVSSFSATFHWWLFHESSRWNPPSMTCNGGHMSI